MTTRWGILSTGRIAHTLADAVIQSKSGELVAVGSRTLANADAMATEYEGIRSHGSYDELIADEGVDAIYVATPHPQHAEWTIKALRNRKAVLCEKPMGLNHPEVMAMVQAARENDAFLMEAFMYRLHPQTQKVVELVRDGAIGDVRHIQATFGFHAPFHPGGRLFANELGGGGILDVGCYPMSMSRLIADSEPVTVQGEARFADTGADLHASAVIRFANGITAQLATAVGLTLDNAVVIYGERGQLRIPMPWQCPPDWHIDLVRGRQHEAFTGTAQSAYIYEVEEVDRCRTDGSLESESMSWADSEGNARALDSWRSAIGLVYDREKVDRLTRPIHGEPLSPHRASMAYGIVPGIDKTVSRVVLGCDNQPSVLHAFAMFDDFFERGGNIFDTAHIYGGGAPERFLGHWMQSRNVRDDVSVIGKGAHTPLNRPEYIAPQLTESLDRLQTNHIDIYFLHRDNTDVPVSEWIDALNTEVNAGRITIFGGSNWSRQRIADANAYAVNNGRQSFSAVSNQFSLARMLSPVWPGCISANDEEYVEFLTSEELTLFPWSSQARGFFTDRVDAVLESESPSRRAESTHPSDAEMQRCWFSDENLERRRRAIELGARYDVDAINIALAYVLNQPFAVFPLIGPRHVSETVNSLHALQVDLSEEEMAYLDLVSSTSE